VANRLESPDPAVPPPGEAIHLPEPSYLPAVLALGLTIALVGLILTFVITAIGAIIVAVALFRWIGQARTEMSELPLEH
jgi:hypothetical protein